MQTNASLKRLIVTACSLHRGRRAIDVHGILGHLPGPELAPSEASWFKNLVRKLARYRECAGYLFRTAPKHTLFRNVVVSPVSLHRDCYTHQQENMDESCLVNCVNRCRGSAGAADIGNTFKARAAALMELDNRKNVKDGGLGFAATLKDIMQKFRIHAEVQIVAHYELHPAKIPPRVIKSSKDACFLCHQFIKDHGKFYTPRTHGRLYNSWRLPTGANIASLNQASGKLNSSLQKRIWEESLAHVKSGGKVQLLVSVNESDVGSLSGMSSMASFGLLTTTTAGEAGTGAGAGAGAGPVMKGGKLAIVGPGVKSTKEELVIAGGSIPSSTTQIGKEVARPQDKIGTNKAADPASKSAKGKKVSIKVVQSKKEISPSQTDHQQISQAEKHTHGVVKAGLAPNVEPPNQRTTTSSKELSIIMPDPKPTILEPIPAAAEEEEEESIETTSSEDQTSGSQDNTVTPGLDDEAEETPTTSPSTPITTPNTTPQTSVEESEPEFKFESGSKLEYKPGSEPGSEPGSKPRSEPESSPRPEFGPGSKPKHHLEDSVIDKPQTTPPLTEPPPNDEPGLAPVSGSSSSPAGKTPSWVHVPNRPVPLSDHNSVTAGFQEPGEHRDPKVPEEPEQGYPDRLDRGPDDAHSADNDDEDANDEEIILTQGQPSTFLLQRNKAIPCYRAGGTNGRLMILPEFITSTSTSTTSPDEQDEQAGQVELRITWLLPSRSQSQYTRCQGYASTADQISGNEGKDTAGGCGSSNLKRNNNRTYILEFHVEDIPTTEEVDTGSRGCIRLIGNDGDVVLVEVVRS